MLYIESFKLPSQQQLEAYCIEYNIEAYPWTIFLDNSLEWVLCKSITIFYGNNGSGKSTLLNLLSEKVNAARKHDLFIDEKYTEKEGLLFRPFADFSMRIKANPAIDDNGAPVIMTRIRELITSDDIFQEIESKVKKNEKTLLEISQNRQEYARVKNEGYQFKSSKDYDQLLHYLDVIKHSKVQYASNHSSKKLKMRSNGENALDYFEDHIQDNGIYFLDEPENCLSPIFQIQLIKLIEDASKYFGCQFFICTHSPLLLSMGNSIIYDLDERPVISKKWNELENVKLYYEFFKDHKKEFE